MSCDLSNIWLSKSIQGTQGARGVDPGGSEMMKHRCLDSLHSNIPVTLHDRIRDQINGRLKQRCQISLLGRARTSSASRQGYVLVIACLLHSGQTNMTKADVNFTDDRRLWVSLNSRSPVCSVPPFPFSRGTIQHHFVITHSLGRHLQGLFGPQ